MAKYELPEAMGDALHFRRTMMFQSRVHKFTLKNVSSVPMSVAWDMIAKIGAEDYPCPFSITPPEVTVDPRSEETFTVRFAPLEVHDFQYVASAFVENLSSDAKPLSFDLSGTASRPLCHFDLERSDYLDRRPQHLISQPTIHQALWTIQRK